MRCYRRWSTAAYVVKAYLKYCATFASHAELNLVRWSGYLDVMGSGREDRAALY